MISGKKKKALVCVFLIWFISIALLVLFSIPLSHINLHDAHVNEYREEIFKQGKNIVAVVLALFIICGAVLGFLTARAIKKKKKKVFIVACFNNVHYHSAENSMIYISTRL